MRVVGFYVHPHHRALIEDLRKLVITAAIRWNPLKTLDTLGNFDVKDTEIGFVNLRSDDHGDVKGRNRKKWQNRCSGWRRPSGGHQRWQRGPFRQRAPGSII